MLLSEMLSLFLTIAINIMTCDHYKIVIKLQFMNMKLSLLCITFFLE